MHFLSAYHQPERSGCSLTLQYAVRQKGSVPVVFAGIFEGKDMPAERLTAWFYERALPCCKKREAAVCVDAAQKLFREEILCTRREGAAFAALFAMGEECFYAWRGRMQIRLFNVCFNRLNVRRITTDSEEYACERAALEADVGLLLGTEGFFDGLRTEALKACLSVRDLDSEKQMRRHLAEAAQEAARRGAESTACVLLKTCPGEKKREACPEELQRILQRHGLSEICPEGGGAFSEVYRVRRGSEPCRLACKVASDERAGAILAGEAALLRQLAHPLFPRYEGYFAEGGYGFLLMEYVEGFDLGRLEEKGALGQERAVRIAADLAEGLRYLHALPGTVLYRDLKPANVRISSDGRTKLLDLGCACTVEDACLSRAGSRGYAAPEQLEGAACGTYSDVYALGKLLRSMLGKEGGKRKAAPDLERLIEDCTACDPGSRPQGMDAVLERLALFCPAGSAAGSAAGNAASVGRQLIARAESLWNSGKRGAPYVCKKNICKISNFPEP